MTVSPIGEIQTTMGDSPHVLRNNQEYKPGSDIPSQTSFYFRLSGSNIYYTSTKNDMIVLGAMNIQNIMEIASEGSNMPGWCFKINDIEKDYW